jgi:hypothetical protein
MLNRSNILKRKIWPAVGLSIYLLITIDHKITKKKFLLQILTNYFFNINFNSSTNIHIGNTANCSVWIYLSNVADRTKYCWSSTMCFLSSNVMFRFLLLLPWTSLLFPLCADRQTLGLRNSNKMNECEEMHVCLKRNCCIIFVNIYLSTKRNDTSNFKPPSLS